MSSNIQDGISSNPLVSAVIRYAKNISQTPGRLTRDKTIPTIINTPQITRIIVKNTPCIKDRLIKIFFSFQKFQQLLFLRYMP